MAAEVGLLTRNIKVVGKDYDLNGQSGGGGQAKQGFGGRMLVGTYQGYEGTIQK